jgi:phosphoenolpyruvate carboxylase
LTAHPTEARRRSVLDKLQAIAGALVERSVPPEVPRLDRPLNAPGSNDHDVESELTALWQTDELRANPLTVTDEVTNTLYFFERSIFDVVAWLHDDLRRALARSYPGAAFRVGRFSGTAHGRRRSRRQSQRDADITWQTLLRHKTRILDHYIAATDALRRELSMSVRLVAFSRELEASLAADAQRITLTAANFSATRSSRMV